MANRSNYWAFILLFFSGILAAPLLADGPSTPSPKPPAATPAPKPSPAPPPAAKNDDPPALVPPRKHPPSPTDKETSSSREELLNGLPADLKKIADRTFSEKPTERAKAADELAKLGERALPALPCLLRLLGDYDEVSFELVSPETDWRMPPPLVCSFAYGALIKIGEPAVAPCLAALEHFAGTDRGDQMIEVLAQLRSPRAIPVFLKLLKNDDPIVRVHVVYAIEFWPDPQFALPLIDALQDRDLQVREAAASAMRFRRDPRFVEPLIASLKNPHFQIRKAVASGLGGQRDPRGVAPLIKLLRDPDENIDVRAYCAEALGSIADQAALDELVVTIKNRSLPDHLRVWATFALRDSKNAEAIKRLAGPLRDHKESEEIRCYMAECISSLGPRQAEPILAPIAVDPDEKKTVRGCCALSLIEITDGAIDDPRIVAALDNPLETNPSITAVVEGAKAKRKAVELLNKNGKTPEVRDATRKLEETWQSRRAR